MFPFPIIVMKTILTSTAICALRAINTFTFHYKMHTKLAGNTGMVLTETNSTSNYNRTAHIILQTWIAQRNRTKFSNTSVLPQELSRTDLTSISVTPVEGHIYVFVFLFNTRSPLCYSYWQFSSCCSTCFLVQNADYLRGGCVCFRRQQHQNMHSTKDTVWGQDLSELPVLDWLYDTQPADINL